jgi:hypothetical protein
MDGKDFNLACYDFSNNLVNLINNSGLPVTAAYLIVKNTLDELEAAKNNTIHQLISQREEQEEKENKEEE